MIGEYERAFYGSQYAAMAPLLEHYGVQLWMPETGGRVGYACEHDEMTMTALGLSSKREITRTSIRVRAAMAVQTREQGRYLGGRPPYGYRLADAGPHPNKAHAAWGRRARKLEPDPQTAPVVRWIFAQRLAGHSTMWQLIAPRFTVNAAAAVAAYTLGTAAAWYETALLLGSPPAGPMFAGLLCAAVYLVFAVAAVTAAASVARSTLGSIGITLGMLLALPVLGIAGPLHPWLPSTLVTAPVAVLDGSTLTDYLPALVIAAASTVLLLAAATFRFGRREV